MSYIPSQHTVSNKPYGAAQWIPTDARSYFYIEGLFKYRPFQDTDEVLEYLDRDKFRGGHFSIYVNESGVLNSDGTFTGGTVTEWWFRDGVEDEHLVPKLSGVGIQSWQDTLLVSSDLTQDNIVDGNTNDFTFDNFTNFIINSNVEINGSLKLTDYPNPGSQVLSTDVDGNVVLIDAPAQRFGIEDDTGVQNRLVSMEGVDLALHDAGTIFFGTGDSSNYVNPEAEIQVNTSRILSYIQDSNGVNYAESRISLTDTHMGIFSPNSQHDWVLINPELISIESKSAAADGKLSRIQVGNSFIALDSSDTAATYSVQFELDGTSGTAQIIREVSAVVESTIIFPFIGSSQYSPLSVNGNFADSSGDITVNVTPNTPNWQETLIEGSTLTQANTITGGNFAFRWNSSKHYWDMAPNVDATLNGKVNILIDDGTPSTINTGLKIVLGRDTDSVFRIYDNISGGSGANDAINISLTSVTGSTLLNITGRQAIFNYGATNAAVIMDGGIYMGGASVSNGTFIGNRTMVYAGGSYTWQTEAQTQTSGTVMMTLTSTGALSLGTVSAPVASAALEVVSTTKGFIPPKMTETQRDAISSPATGLMIYNTTTNKLNLYTGTWEQITSS